MKKWNICKLNKITLYIILFVCLTAALKILDAQDIDSLPGDQANPENSWIKLYSEYDPYAIKAIIPTDDGGCLLYGGYNSYFESGSLIKLDENGNVSWYYDYGDPYALHSNQNLLKKCFISKDGNIVCFGISVKTYQHWFHIFGADGDLIKEYNYAEDDFYSSSWFSYANTCGLGFDTISSWQNTISITRINNDYTLEFIKSTDFPDTCDIGMAFPLKDGGYFLSVLYGQDPSKAGDSVFMKLDRYGAITWQKENPSHLNTRSQWWQKDLREPWTTTNDGGYLLAISGYEWGTEDEQYYYLFIKLTQDGTIQWEKKHYCNDSIRSFCDIIQTQDNGYALSGYGYSANNEERTILLKLNFNGDVEWYNENDSPYGLPGEPNHIIQCEDGSFLIIQNGEMYFDNKQKKAIYNGIVFVRIGKNGEERISERILDLPEGVFDAVPSKDGGCFILGSRKPAWNEDDVSWKFWVIKTDKNGYF